MNDAGIIGVLGAMVALLSWVVKHLLTRNTESTDRLIRAIDEHKNLTEKLCERIDRGDGCRYHEAQSRGNSAPDILKG